MARPFRSASLSVLAKLTHHQRVARCQNAPKMRQARQARQAIRQKLHRFTGARDEHVQIPPETPEASRTLPPTGLNPLFDSNDAVVEYVKPQAPCIFVLMFYSLIFVHGLGGDPGRTWTGHSAASPWPGDILPASIPNIRVLTFGYDSSVTRLDRMVSRNNVNDHALGLMNSIAAYREKDQTVP